MVGELIMLPLRVGVRATQLWLRATEETVAMAAGATSRVLGAVMSRGSNGAALHFEIKCQTDNQLVLTFNCNAWGALIPGKPARLQLIV